VVAAPPGYISINDAAAALGKKPYEIIRLIEANTIRAVTLVEAASLAQVAE
jgi:hypothetical protein